MYSVCCVTHMGPTVPQALTWLVAVSSVAQFMEEVSAKKRRVPMQEQTCSSPVTQLQSPMLTQVQRCPGAHNQKLTGVSRSLRWAICWFIKQRRKLYRLLTLTVLRFPPAYRFGALSCSSSFSGRRHLSRFRCTKLGERFNTGTALRRCHVFLVSAARCCDALLSPVILLTAPVATPVL